MVSEKPRTRPRRKNGDTRAQRRSWRTISDWEVGHPRKWATCFTPQAALSLVYKVRSWEGESPPFLTVPKFRRNTLSSWRNQGGPLPHLSDVMSINSSSWSQILFKNSASWRGHRGPSTQPSRCVTLTYLRARSQKIRWPSSQSDIVPRLLLGVWAIVCAMPQSQF